MKKGIAPVAVIAVFVVAASALALAHRPAFPGGHPEWAGWHGKGFAVSTSDPASFEPVAIKLKEGSCPPDGECMIDPGAVSSGVLKFGGEELAVRNITKNNGTISGDLYRNDSKAGSFSITNVDEDGKPKVWYGSLNIDGKDYRLYMFGHLHHPWKPISILKEKNDKNDDDNDDHEIRGERGEHKGELKIRVHEED